MSETSYEYDVFISFAAQDEGLVRPLWQELTSSGLRVFWSDVVLRDHVGTSWSEVIQESLGRSRHFLLVCTPASLASTWVSREYKAFFNHCYHPPARVLVPVLAAGARVDQLPLFLRDVEACFATDADLKRRLIDAFGGVGIAELKARLSQREEELRAIRRAYQDVSHDYNKLNKRLSLTTS